ncbi:hypothetical protein BKA63DRAFT_84893 [Paraphoma chrysanthemicola]|nr:hypothetical protein BKA63DRAFT_84893 [Paraphoma chrysanthemicola]
MPASGSMEHRQQQQQGFPIGPREPHSQREWRPAFGGFPTLACKSTSPQVLGPVPIPDVTKSRGDLPLWAPTSKFVFHFDYRLRLAYKVCSTRLFILFLYVSALLGTSHDHSLARRCVAVLLVAVVYPVSRRRP